MKFFRFIGDKLLNRQLDFRARIFNLLAMTGMVLGVIIAVSNYITNAGAATIIVCLLASALAFGLLEYARRTGRYKICYMITVVTVFLIAFPILFFAAGGYHSGMPAFFVFAIMFTVFMLDGKKMFVMAAIEMAVYIGVCLIAFSFPQTVRFFETEQDVMADIIIGFSVVSIALGITMFLHFRLYNQQQRELEAAREDALNLSQSKSNFLANMSHEIRTPINVMLGMNEMILRESDSEQVKGYGQNIQNAGKTLLTLINNILDVSKIETGKLMVIEEPYQAADFIDDLSMIGVEQAGRYGLAFHANVDETIPRVLIGDAIHIKQVAVNFLSNAAKYTKQGSVTLTVGQKPGSKPDQILLCVSIADTGIGIKEENLALLFDAFTRADMPSNRYIEGTGLGLAIAKELTELMGGRIHVESKWGKGSVFSMEIPQKISDETPLGKAERAAAKGPQAHRAGFIAPGGSVLLVDDNKENLQVIRSLLSRTMLRVDAANSGVECLEAVKDIRYDVILMDYMMPGMDGLETLNRLSAVPGFDTPVIALTANVVAGVKQKLQEAGFREYLSKPVMWRDLEAALLALLPGEMITPSMADSSSALTWEMKNELEQELSAYGVILSDGLHYLSGDIVQYKTLASFFMENYEPGRNEIHTLAGQKDWERMKFCVHSLKSKAQAIGANTLSDTAAKLEALCVAGGGAYIEVMLPVLSYEWERARDGLCSFAARLDAILPDTAKQPGYPAELDELLPLIRHNRQPDALDMLESLIDNESASERLKYLREIRQKVDEVEFREAERLLFALMGGEADGE